MSPDSMLYMFVALRSAHIAVAALWLGSAALLVWYVMPSAANLAPEIVTRLVRNKHHLFMASLGGTTVLSGLLLYWHLTGFSAAGMGSHAGIAYAIGGVLGLTALIIGGGVVGKSAAKIAELHASAGEGARNSETTAAIQMLGRRAAGGGRVVVALLLATLILMTLGHFV
jgi:hypothetical protein